MLKFDSFSIEKFFILIIILVTLAPSFGAIDNNAIRWTLLSVSSAIFLFKLLLEKKSEFSVSVRSSFLVFFSCLYIAFSIFHSYNSNEGLVASYKLVTILGVFYSVLIAFRRIESPIIFLSQVFTISLFVECLFLIFEFVLSDFYVTGISNNRNISTSSILVKFSFLIFLINKSKERYKIGILKMIEFFVIISVVLLQSRLGLVSLIGIYLSLLLFDRKKRVNYIISLILITICLVSYSQYDGIKKRDKEYSLLELKNDESGNQRLSFYSNALKIIKESPIIGKGIGSWKYESLKNNKDSRERILSSYYTHNDFLQIIVELGILGILIYMYFIISLLKSLFRNFNSEESKIFFFIPIIYLLINSSLNFPIHRSQEFIPFVLCASLIFSKDRIDSSKKMKPNIFYLLILLIIPSCFIGFYEHKSLTVQNQLLLDYKNQNFNLDEKQLSLVSYKLPNLMANTVPISTYLSRYYFEEGDYERSLDLLKYSTKANRNDLMTKELILKNYIFLDDQESAFSVVNDLMSRYPDNEIYAQVYFSIISDLDYIDVLVDDPIIYRSNNIIIHKMFHDKIRNYDNVSSDLIMKFIKFSNEMFPNFSFN